MNHLARLLLGRELFERTLQPAVFDLRAIKARKLADSSGPAGRCRIQLIHCGAMLLLLVDCLRLRLVSALGRGVGLPPVRSREQLRFALRMLARQPGFSLTAIATLGIGLGATITVFSVVNAVFLQPLPYQGEKRLVHIFSELPNGELSPFVSYPDFVDFTSSGAFAGAALWQGTELTLAPAGRDPVRADGALVSWQYFDVLGVVPRLGRFFAADDQEAGGDYSVVISHRLWQSHFGGGEVLGDRVELGGTRGTVVGITAPDFVDPLFASGSKGEPEFWLAMRRFLDHRGIHSNLAVGRLAADLAPAAAQSQLSSVAQTLAQEYPETNKGRGGRIVTLRDHLTGPLNASITLLLAAVVLLLAISCGNVANLMMGRVIARSPEIGVRTALGAGRGRIIAQFLWESLLLAGCGSVAGLALAWGLIRYLSTVDLGLPRAVTLEIDTAVVLLAIGLSLLAGMTSGALPAIYSTRMGLSGLGREFGTNGAATAGSSLRRAVVVAEMATAMALLSCAGLLATSFLRLRSVDSGLELQSTLTLEVTPPVSDFPTADDLTRIFGRVLERVRQLPGVTSAGAINRLPMSGAVYRQQVSRVDRPPPESGAEANALMRAVVPGYFESVGIPLLQGRTLASTDDQNGPRVAVINASLRRRLFPGGRAVGRQVSINNASYEVVGVVADVRFFGLQREFDRALYVPYAAETDGWLHRRSMFLTVRTAGDPRLPAGVLRSTVREEHRGIVVAKFRTMVDIAEETVARPRLRAMVLLIFSLAALLVTAVGITAVAGYNVSRRTSEIGLRMALGATRGSVTLSVLGEAAKMSSLGLGIGLLLAAGLARLLSSLLSDIRPGEPAVYVASLLVLGAVALLACWLPAQRASRVDPLQALREN